MFDNGWRHEHFFVGQIGQIGLWSVTLTDEEIGRLGKGADPRDIRPEALVHYSP